MTAAIRPSVPMDALRQIFGSQLRENITMADYTTAHVGGIVDALLIVNNNLELESACRRLWDLDVFFCVLGSGSNVLVSDGGIRGMVIINRARALRINHPSDSPSVWVESGASLSGLARQVALRGLSGLEWAAGIPGTVGGAVVNNAGSREGNIQTSLMVAEILHQVNGKEIWSSSQFDYAYRSSILKGIAGHAVILTAELKLVPSTLEEVQSRMSALNARRRETQPSGASMGSMFKNPAGDHAGRLIEAAGLKGTCIGGAVISDLHANFFINRGSASANDFDALIRLAQTKVQEQFRISLELEVERLGEWQTGSSTDVK